MRYFPTRTAPDRNAPSIRYEGSGGHDTLQGATSGEKRRDVPELSVRSELVAAGREGVIPRGQIDSDSRTSMRIASRPASSVIPRTLFWRQTHQRFSEACRGLARIKSKAADWGRTIADAIDRLTSHVNASAATAGWVRARIDCTAGWIVRRRVVEMARKLIAIRRSTDRARAHARVASEACARSPRRARVLSLRGAGSAYSVSEARLVGAARSVGEGGSSGCAQ